MGIWMEIMKKLFIILLFLNCGHSITPSLKDFAPYEPAYVNVIGQKVFERNGLDYSKYKINYYYGEDTKVTETCIGKSNIFISACVFQETNDIIIKEIVKDRCRIIAHELIHQALYLSNQPDHDHENPQFDEILEFCKSLGLPIENWS